MTIARTMALALSLLLACGGGGKEDSPPPGRPGRAGAGGGIIPREGLSLLLVSIDTCRPDRLGCYGNDSIDTPRIDELAERGARFERCVSSAPITLPSHTSLLTSTFPYRHRVRNNGTYRVRDESTTLAEWMKAEGYRTAAFVGAFPLDSRFGLSQGFDLYDDDFPPARVGSFDAIAERPADEVVDRAVRWLSAREKKPFFLFVHFFDPHWPYKPPEPFLGASRSPYEGEIAFVDGEVGRLVDALDDLDLADRTVVILTGDHGEGLGDHGEMTHTVFNYESTLRVPLMIAWPERASFRNAGLVRGTRIASQVREVDIAPTALELVGLPPLPDAQGRGLVPLLREPGRTLDLVNYAESLADREDYGWSELRSISTDEWKFILLPRQELYHLSADPGETSNVIAEHPDVAERLRGMLRERIDEDERRAGESARIELDQESREKLEALGYVTARRTPESLSSAGLPDPKDRVGLLGRFFAGKSAVDHGRPAKGLEILLDVEGEDPGNPRLIASIGDAYLALDDGVRADSAYRIAISLMPSDLNLRSNRVQALLFQGKPEEALEICRTILATDPEVYNAHARLGEVYQILGRPELAAEAYQKELEIHPASPMAYNGLGKLYKTQGRVSEAGKYYRKAIEARRDFAEAYYNLGNLYNDRGNVEKAVHYYQTAIEKDPVLGEAYYNLALLAKQHGRRHRAAELLEEAVKNNPRFGKGYYGLGNLLREEGKPDLAVAEYAKALLYDPKDANVYLNLGVAYAALRDLRSAIAAWETTIRLAPGSPSAKTAGENIRGARAQTGGNR